MILTLITLASLSHGSIQIGSISPVPARSPVAILQSVPFTYDERRTLLRASPEAVKKFCTDQQFILVSKDGKEYYFSPKLWQKEPFEKYRAIALELLKSDSTGHVVSLKNAPALRSMAENNYGGFGYGVPPEAKVSLTPQYVIKLTNGTKTIEATLLQAGLTDESPEQAVKTKMEVKQQLKIHPLTQLSNDERVKMGPPFRYDFEQVGAINLVYIGSDQAKPYVQAKFLSEGSQILADHLAEVWATMDSLRETIFGKLKFPKMNLHNGEPYSKLPAEIQQMIMSTIDHDPSISTEQRQAFLNGCHLESAERQLGVTGYAGNMYSEWNLDFGKHLKTPG